VPNTTYRAPEYANRSAQIVGSHPSTAVANVATKWSYRIPGQCSAWCFDTGEPSIASEFWYHSTYGEFAMA